MVIGISGAANALAVYSRQQFYAQRTHELNIPKTVQVGAQDRVSLSPEAVAVRSASAPSASQQAAVTVAISQHAVYSARPMTYEDPRRGATARHGAEEHGQGETASKESGSGAEDAESTTPVTAAGESGGQQQTAGK
ncbi:MAG: hypothetical protein HZB29_13510 [Nitrospinae bacterium]|nr:hypothetical protein [Nitrospinota bacterium]